MRVEVCAASPASRPRAVAIYLHKTCKDLPPQVGVVVGYDGGRRGRARDIATHIAAFAPDRTSPARTSRPTTSRTSAASPRRPRRNEGKPEAALPKIIEGRLNGFFKENVLLEQAFATDNKKTVAQVLAEAGVTRHGLRPIPRRRLTQDERRWTRSGPFRGHRRYQTVGNARVNESHGRTPSHP